MLSYPDGSSASCTFEDVSFSQNKTQVTILSNHGGCVTLDRQHSLDADKRRCYVAGLMISGYARAAQVFGDAALTQRAERAARFLRDHAYNPDTRELYRSTYTAHVGDGPHE